MTRGAGMWRAAPIVAVYGAVAVIACLGTTVQAQQAGSAPVEGPRARSLELTGNVLWVGGTLLGSTSATLTPNQIGQAPRFTLFKADNRLESSIGYEARLGFNITRVVAAEAGFTRSRPSLKIKISDDAEGASAATLSSDRQFQFLLDASLMVHLTRFAVGKHAIPFAFGGAGQLRQLYKGSVFVETGRTFHVGGGVKYFARSRSSGFLRGIGIRADARVYLRNRRLDFANKARATVVGGVGGLVAF